MKLLTKAEYEEIVVGAKPCVGPDNIERVESHEEPLFEALEAQGRMELVDCLCCPQPHSVWFATPAGREALKLWPMLVERGLVQP